MKKVFVLTVVAFFLATAFTPFAPSAIPNLQDGACPNFGTIVEIGGPVTSASEIPLVESPGSTTIVGTIPVPDVNSIEFGTATEGPVCKDLVRWFKISYSGTEGWASEVGPDGVYNYTRPAMGGAWGDYYASHIMAGGQRYAYDKSENKLFPLPNQATAEAIGLSRDSQSDTLPDGAVIMPPVPDFVTRHTDFCVYVRSVFYPAVLDYNDCEKVRAMGIIQIGPDIYVVLNAQRQLVPNPDTLDALGISRNMIDNVGLDEAGLNSIPRGADIPDINRDPSGFQTYKQLFDRWVAPKYGISGAIQSAQSQSTAQPSELQVVPTDVPLPPDGYSDDDFACSLGLCAYASVSTSCSPQCVTTARTKRDDLVVWGGQGTSDQILEAAQKQPIFPYKGQSYQVRVRSQNEAPQPGDLVIWPSGCGGAWSRKDANGNALPGGHIGYVTSGNPFRITDSNWGTPNGSACATRTDQPITIKSCMRFITAPFLPGSSNGSPVDKCSKYSPWDPRGWWCRLTTH